jgi:hypothetical protein
MEMLGWLAGWVVGWLVSWLIGSYLLIQSDN